MISREQPTFAESRPVSDTLQIPWDDVLRLVVGGELRAPEAGAAEPSADGIADDVRRRVAGTVAREVAERERRNEAIHQQLEHLLRGPLHERLLGIHGRLAGDAQRRKEAIGDMCAAVADAAHGELTGWLRRHVGPAIRDDLTTVLRDRLDEVLRAPALRDQLTGAAHNGGASDLMLVLREHLVKRLHDRLAEDAGPAVADRMAPKVKEALRARLCDIFADPGVDARVREFAKIDAELFAAMMSAMAANLGRNALDDLLQESVGEYLDSMFSGRTQVFRDEIRKVLTTPPAGVAPRPEVLAGGPETAQIIRAAELGIAGLIRDRIDQVARDRMIALVRARIRDALQLAVSPQQIGFDLGLRSEDLTRISDAIWERWGYVIRERLERWIGERVAAQVGTRVAESVRAALAPSVLELAAMTSAPTTGASTAAGATPGKAYSVF